MRCTIPIRKAAQAIARAVDFTDPNDVNFLFYSELRALATGKQSRKSFEPVIGDRKLISTNGTSELRKCPSCLVRRRKRSLIR